MVLITVSASGVVRVQLVADSEEEERELARFYARLTPAIGQLRRLAAGRRSVDPVPPESMTLADLR